MPWCDDCARFWSPPSLHEGACPTCGTVLTRPAATSEPSDGSEERPRAPWHFKVMLVALVVYLGYRAYQGVDWLARWAPKHL